MIRDIRSTTILNNGVEMPWLGLGVLRLNEGGEVENAVRIALENGYRLIDNASIYHNEKGVAKGIKASGIPREELFLSSKIANDQQGYHSTFKAFQRSLDWLQTDYLDLYLIHWPQGEVSVETWLAMEELYKKGKIRAIGVSNFWVHHLEYFLPKINVVPAVNQVEFHPRMTQSRLLQFCQERNIQVEAWSPIMQGQVLKIPEIKKLAKKYGKSPAQIVLRWDLQKGVITIPRSSKKSEIIQNANIFDFEIDEEDIVKIDNLNKNKTVFPYYDKIPFLIQALGYVEKKNYVLRLLIKAIMYKTSQRIKRLFMKDHEFIPLNRTALKEPAVKSHTFVKK
jgi:methylglyoxal/glyoxal reductase